jgi:hypothetical protein
VSEKLNLVRSIYANWERGDWSVSTWADPDIEFVIADGPDPASCNGLLAMAAAWREFLAAWSGYSIAADEYRELDDERVFVLLHAGGEGKASGLVIPGEVAGANLFHVRGGLVKRLVVYFDHRHALGDLGIGS